MSIEKKSQINLTFCIISIYNNFLFKFIIEQKFSVTVFTALYNRIRIKTSARDKRGLERKFMIVVVVLVFQNIIKVLKD